MEPGDTGMTAGPPVIMGGLRPGRDGGGAVTGDKSAVHGGAVCR